MSRISDNLSVLVDAKGAIAAAIESKGGTVTGGLTDYASAIRAIPGGAEFPVGTKFAYSTWSEIPAAVKSYVVGLGDSDYMFYSCTNLSEVNLELPNASNLAYCFYYNTSLRNASLDIPNVSIMDDCFHYCYNLTEVNLINAHKLQSARACFENCSRLVHVSIDGAPTNIASMLSNCTSLTSVTLNVSQVQLATSAFANANKLREVVFIGDLSNCTGLFYTFGYCSSLESIELSQLSRITNMDRTFYNCSALTSVKLYGLTGGTGPTPKLTWSYTFYNCSNLEYLDFDIIPAVSATGWGLSTCTKLTHDALMNIINALEMFSGVFKPTCTLGTTNLAKLTVDEIAIATNKGWILN